MSRIWRGDVRLLLAFAAAVEVLLVVYTRTAGAVLNAHQPLGPQLAETGFGLFLLWRVWRGGRVAWLVIVVMDALLLVATAAGVAAVGPYQVGLWGFVAVQLAVLASPAVRRQVGGHRGRAAASR